MAKRKSAADWARIEIEYLAGEDSVREIADRHEISDTAIRKKAKSEGWVRMVRTLRSANLREPRREPASRAPSEPAEPVDPAKVADHGRGLVARMLDELDMITAHAGEIEEMIFAETDDDVSPRRRDAMLKAISLGGRATTMRSLANALKTLNEAFAPIGKKAAAQEKANEVGRRFAPLGPPTLKAVK